MTNLLLIILEQACFYFPIILGAYISFSLMKVPDLSIQSAYVFGAIVTAKLIPFIQGCNSIVYLFLVVAASMIGGFIVGIVSGALTEFVKIPHLLSSILTIGLFHGIGQFVMGTPNISISQFENPLITGIFPSSPELAMLLLIATILATAVYFLLKTQLGLSFVVYGNNTSLFSYYGISTRFVFVCALALSNALAGLSGYLVSQGSGFVDINSGAGMALFCVTALILGKAFFMKSARLFSILVPILGILTYYLLQQLLLDLGFNLKYFTMIQSFVVLLVLAIKYRMLAIPEIKDHLGV